MSGILNEVLAPARRVFHKCLDKWSIRQRSSVILWKTTTLAWSSSLQHLLLTQSSGARLLQFIWIYLNWKTWFGVYLLRSREPQCIRQTRQISLSGRKSTVLTLCMHDHLHRGAVHTHIHVINSNIVCATTTYAVLHSAAVLFFAIENEKRG